MNNLDRATSALRFAENRHNVGPNDPGEVAERLKATVC